jgi:RecB family exonuclease
MGHSGDESGYVRILSAPNIRSLQIPCLFLAGLSEKAFPPPDRDDRMYSEADYARLIEAGLPLVARTERTRDEMLLFYEAVTRASKRLYLSYPALDESVQPLLPSPFLREVEDSLGPKNIPRVERADLRPIPADDEPISQAEYRVKALDLAFRGNVAMLAGLLRDTKVTAESKRNQTPAPQTTSSGPSLLSGLQIIHERQDRDRFGPAEGILTSPKACDRTARRFSENRVFSATDLEDYAYCPFRFFLLKTLGLQPLEDLSLEFDFINRGRVVHDILKTFHQSVQRRLGRSVSPMKLDEAEFNELLTAAIEESLPAESPNPVQAALDEINRRTVVQWMSQYREQYQKYETKWKDFDVPTTPELFEVSFGDKKAAAPSTTETLDFDRDGHVVHIAGRIDRIDLGMVGGESAITVIDYKTGGKIAVTAESVRAGLTLQLPLYSLAATELLLPDRDALPWQAGYWYIRDHGFATKKPPLQMYCEKDGRIEIDPQWEEIRDALGDVVVALVRSMRRGRFPVCCADEHCTGRCPCHTTCRIHQIRSLEKTCLLTASDENEPA